MIHNTKRLIFGSLGVLTLVVVLGLAVWRIGDIRTFLQRPKATGGAGFCVDPNTTFHLACGSNNTCVRKRGAGSNLNGCVTVGQTCTVCPSGQTLCTASCVDLQTNNNNCSSCGHACPTGQSCTAGACVPPLAANECEACEGSTGKSCASGLVCHGVCVKNDGTTKCGPCSADNSCATPLMCVED